jgi:hypothetical protein
MEINNFHIYAPINISMKLFMKFILIVLTIVIALSAMAYFVWYKPTYSIAKASMAPSANHIEDNSTEVIRLKKKEAGIKKYLTQNNFNTHYCFMVDMYCLRQETFFCNQLKK